MHDVMIEARGPLKRYGPTGPATGACPRVPAVTVPATHTAFTPTGARGVGATITARMPPRPAGPRADGAATVAVAGPDVPGGARTVRS